MPHPTVESESDLTEYVEELIRENNILQEQAEVAVKSVLQDQQHILKLEGDICEYKQKQKIMDHKMKSLMKENEILHVKFKEQMSYYYPISLSGMPNVKLT